jgi:hypothetical protein
MKILITSLILLMVFTCNEFAATDTLVIFASGPSLDKVINGDINIDGSQKHIYKLVSVDTTYVFDNAITVKSDFTIVGQLGSGGRPPCIQPDVLSDNSIPTTLFVMTGNNTRGLIKNLYLMGLSLNGLPAQGALGIAIQVSADNIKLTVDNCVFEEWRAFAIGYMGNWDSFFLTNNKFRNAVDPMQQYEGEVLRLEQPGTAYTDSIVMRNNTIIGINCYTAAPVTKVYERYFEFTHNNIVYSFKNPFFIFNVTNAKINNNIFYSTYAGGISKVEYPWYDQLWNPEIGSVIDMDTLDFAKDEIFNPADIGKPNFKMLSEAKRTVEVKNNVCFWPQSVKDFWNSWNDTAHVDSIYTPSWMNTRTTGMFNNKTVWPGFVESGNLNVDPGFGASIPDVLNNASGLNGVGFFNYFRKMRSGIYSNDIWGYKIQTFNSSSFWKPEWPLPETNDMRYSNTALKTGGTDGKPVGDLWWWKDNPTSTIIITSPHGGENWQPGTTHNITWSSSGITNLNIELSTDYGSTWNIVANNVAASTGTYSWMVPNSISNSCKIKLTDAGESNNYVESNDVFAIKNIVLTAPFGGEVWQANTTHNITWLEFGDTSSSVTIDLSTDGGTSWINLNTVFAGKGTYNWTVPPLPCTLTKIRVSYASMPDISSRSLHNFTMTTNSAQAVLLTSPNGGTEIEARSSQNITWTATSGIPVIKIELTTDKGATWSSITNFILASSGTFNWTVPNVHSSDCKVRITADTMSGNVYDVSDSVFAIIRPAFTLLSPNGGNIFKCGSTQNITWAASPGISKIKIDLTTDEGTTWNMIANNIAAASGTFSWTVPSSPSSNCKIKLSDASDSTLYVMSNIDFTIKGLALTSPIGGEIWLSGTSASISWIQFGVSNIKIEYSTNNGAYWYTIVVNDSASKGTYTWSVPFVFSGQCRVKISDADDLTLTDMSANQFRIWHPIIESQTPIVGQNALNFSASNALLDLFVFTPVKITTTYYGFISPQSGTLPVGINSVSQYYWLITTTGTISFINGSIEVSVSSLPGVNNAANLVWLKRTNPGDAWTNIGGTITAGNLVSTVPFKSFSEFAIGSTGDDPVPINITQFSALQEKDYIHLNWETATEVNNSGFAIEKKAGDKSGWAEVGFVKGSGNSTEKVSYTFRDKILPAGKYNYRLRQVDFDGSVRYSTVVNIEIKAPDEFTLSQNYPNPFNPNSKIEYTLPNRGHVMLQVFSLTGQILKTLVNDNQEAGYYSVNFSGENLSSGMYIYRLSFKDKSFVKKMLYLK